MARGLSLPGVTLALLGALAPLRAHEEWNNLHIVYSAKTAFVYPFDGRSPKVAAVLLNHHDTASPEVVFNFAVNGQLQGDGGFTRFPNGGNVVVRADNYLLATAQTAGVFDSSIGAAPAVGETKEFTFEFKFTLAPGAKPVADLDEDHDDDADAVPTDPTVPYTQTQKVTFTNLGENPPLFGPLPCSGAIDLPPLATAPGAGGVFPRAEVATPYSGWMPLAIDGKAGGTHFTFAASLPARDDWHVRLSAPGFESRVIALGHVNDPRPSLSATLAVAPTIDFDYVPRAILATPTGFWRGAVSESEGTFVAFPGEENWPVAATDAAARVLRAASRIYKYKFDGTKLWEHAPGWETWGGDMTPDGRFVAYVLNPTASSFYTPAENKLVLLDGATGSVLWTKAAPPADAAVGQKLDALELAFSPDAKWIAVGSVSRGTVTLVERATGNFAWTIPGADAPAFGQVRKLRFSPDSQFLYCGSGDSQLRQLRVSDGAVLWTNFAGGWPSVNGLDLTPDGSWLVAGTQSFDTTLVRASDGRIEWQKESQFAGAGFSPDGRHLVTSGGQIYRTVDGSLAGATQQSAVARFTPDGRYVLQVARDLRLYDLGGALVRTFAGTALPASAAPPPWAYLTRDGRFAIVLGAGTAGLAIFERVPLPAAAPLPPTIAILPLAQTVNAGATATLAVNATGAAPLSYQWRKNNADLPGQNSPVLMLPAVSAADAADYSVVVANANGSIASGGVPLAVVAPDATNPARLANVSVRAKVGATPIILGFAIGGAGASGQKPLLVRGSGPALVALGAIAAADALPDPRITLYSGPVPLQGNDSWFGDAQVTALAAQLGAFPFTAPLSKDAALATALGGGSFTVQLASNDAASGIALAEIYDASATFAATTPRLVNLSARGDAATGDDSLIAGFVILGPAAKTVLIRGIGPGLAPYNVFNFLIDPQLTLHRGNDVIAANDNWYDAPNAVAIAAAALEAGAFTLPPGSRDAAVLLTLPPGGYTVKVSSATGVAGNALAEVYEVR